VKTVEMADATASLSDYARKTRKETLARTDLENLVVTTHSTFKAIIERSEARYKTEGGLSTEQVRLRLAARRNTRRKHR
jgi:hypothetical protein